MTIRELLNQGVIMLKNENIDSPKNKARSILEHTLKKSKEYIIIYDKIEVTSEQRNAYVRNIKRLIQGEPLQYITGMQEFMKLKFLVTKDVLIPQPDTEILVEEVLDILSRKGHAYILDLCTGSGAIAISLAKYTENVKIIASDISKKALEIAKKNAQFNGVLNKIEFIESNMFNKLKDKKFDLIVSNPPYIPTDDISTLDIDVQNEPRLALDGGKDGLDFYRKIAQDGYKYLKEDGYLCVEIGYNQKENVKKIFIKENKYYDIYSKKDLCQNDRVIVARKIEEKVIDKK